MKIPHYLLMVLAILVGILGFARMTRADDINIDRESTIEEESESSHDHSDHSHGETEQFDDAQLVSEQMGLPLADIEKAIAFQEAFSAYADELLARYPEQISAVWVDQAPNTQGYIRFVGKIPVEVSTEVKNLENVDGDNIVLLEDGLLSIEDHIRRAELSAIALNKLGYDNLATFYDFTTQKIQLEVKILSVEAMPDLTLVANAIEEEVQKELTLADEPRFQGATSVIEPSDLNLTILIGTEPIMSNEHSRGGNWLRDDGVRECTSGWAVNGPNGDGIVTAAHCTGLNQFEEPGVTPYSMTWRDQEWGSGGDAEYHTTTHIEPAEFYATSSSIRDVNSIKSTNTMVGNTVCVYGRSSNSRSCSHSIEAVGVTVYDSDCSCNVGNLARSNNHTTIGGDSGGGWSYNFTAWGVHKGGGGGKSYFTPVQQTQNALNVTIKTK